MWLLLLLLILPVWGAQGAVVFTTLYSFQVFANGEYPSGLVQGSDGNFYGTTSEGGTNGAGTVFKISTNGALTSLYSFTGGNDGGAPNGLVQGSDGSFYGTTGYGGTNDSGSVFKIGTNGALTTLYSFTGGNDGGAPTGLVRGSDGNFYGTTWGGGTNGAGTVFRISTSGALTTLYSFTGSNDGANPAAALVQGSDWYFYGTTEYGAPSSGNGTVFKISANGALTTLYSFTGSNDGANPAAALVQGSDGYFYGTTEYSGPSGGNGTVFKISANGVLTTLHSFSFTNDGSGPSGLVHGSDGNFYGTTERGGPSGGNGTVFKISTNGAFTSLYSFTGGSGYPPNAGLVQGNDGYFYGTTSGGPDGDGAVFKISTNGALTTLYSFAPANDGASPAAALVQGSDGYFYGTTERGGPSGGNGTVFKISANGVLTTLHSFSGTNDGAFPSALMQGSDGYFYGTTSGGGTYTNGTVFQISPNGALTSLYSFTGGNDGSGPNGLAQGSDGNFYGTTSQGGSYPGPYGGGGGTVFKISPNGALTSLYSFTGGNDGAQPLAGVVQGSDGNFYGTTYYGGSTNPNTGQGVGTVFKITPNGTLTSLYSFTNANDGGWPVAGLVQGSEGNFYGTTYDTVFRISTNGALTTLRLFGSGNDGANPAAGLVQGSDGNFYGTTSWGGAGGAGTVFRLTIVPQPQLTIIPSGPYVILAWPTNYAGVTLQSTTNLGSSAVWTTNSSPPVVIGGENVVVNPISGRQQFYRLSQ